MPRRQRSADGGALRRFLSTEVAGGAVLVVAAVVALAWANAPWSEAYRDLWDNELGPLDLRHWINDGLMSVFFLVVALEIKRELTTGELRERRNAALPVFAAGGGMLVPAAIYLAINAGGAGARGWGIPMATDIAFAVGVLALLGRTLPSGLRVFLLALAIVDDIGAILVIAVFYSSGVELVWLAGTLAVLVVALIMRRASESPAVYVVLGIALWVALEEAGVHPTLAGVGVGLLVPATQTESWEAALHSWTSLLIVPLFALANAGVTLSASALDDASSSPVTWGIGGGLVVGKPLGICAFAWLAVRLGVATLPSGGTWRQLTGTAALAGIGFTVSLFVTRLAFTSPDLVDQATVGVLAASLLATGMAAAILLPRAR
ncbi:MAG: Na+:H+ antiporter, NhaA family [Actinomycetota bacterium]